MRALRHYFDTEWLGNSGGIVYPVEVVRLAKHVPPSGPDHLVEHVVFENKLELIGYSIEPQRAAVGETLRLTLFWLALSRVDKDYTVFVHLLDTNNQAAGQFDGYPATLDGVVPTSEWLPGSVVVDERDVVLERYSDGPLSFSIGLYLLDTMQRLSLINPDGAFSGTALTLPTPVEAVVP